MRLIALLLGLTLCLSSPLSAAFAQAPTPDTPVIVQHTSLSAPDGRLIDVSIWPADHERGVVVFSHGLNGSPEPYNRILKAWADHGYTVVAPLHVDSLRHPDHARYDNRAAFSARIADLAVVRGYVGNAHQGKPVIAAGHSFGSLLSLISAGAVTAAGPIGDPSVKGVIAFSSAGDLPGLVNPQTYATMATPLLMITGDADLVPGFVSDWTQHRSPFDRSPAGDKYLMVVDGGNHELVARSDDAIFTLMENATETFLDAYGLEDETAKQKLTTLPMPDHVTWERR